MKQINIQHHKRNSWIGIFFCLLVLAGCGHADTQSEIPVKEYPPGYIYFDYRASGDEETGLVTVRLQFRQGYEAGAPLLLEAPGQVTLDGDLLMPDSTKLSGVYYEASLPLREFGGQHRVVMTASDGKEYIEEFEYPLISLETSLDSTIYRGNWEWMLSGIKTGDMVSILLTDTSFYGRGLDKILDSMQDGRILIRREELVRLKNGPVSLEIYREQEKPLSGISGAGGMLLLSYRLNRGFVLKDSL